MIEIDSLEDLKEDIMIATAIRKARDAFDKEIENKGFDPAFWSLDLKVYWISNDFDAIIRVQEDIDVSRKPEKKEKEFLAEAEEKVKHG